ncbi:calmodulin-like protein 6 [Drosophila ficusphila]|uniref:calmodulin-like protein 6 n=1 Tax=Drosophila ficusphila TaxID=30025 RepID=UPI0007E78FF4|nr:calmodulin-like protein 6 [Drosophila ficusphila]XP_017050443.1 calmodulin-like protein 6 [Drosophila ficusphila]XP_017050451.1 calmodulin-like protein 6 [Drosophila ficusphila]
MSDLSDQDKTELKEVYDLLCKDSATGQITTVEVNILLQHLNRRPCSAELHELLSPNATDGSEIVDLDRFCRIMILAEQEEMLLESFHRFDRNGDGVLSVEELHLALEETLSEKPDRSTIEEMMQEADPEGTGAISYASFLKMALKYERD